MRKLGTIDLLVLLDFCSKTYRLGRDEANIQTTGVVNPTPVFASRDAIIAREGSDRFV